LRDEFGRAEKRLDAGRSPAARPPDARQRGLGGVKQSRRAGWYLLGSYLIFTWYFKVLDCDEDDWCQLGPGALRGDDPAPKRRNGTGAFYLEKSRHVGLKRVFAHAPPATCAVNLDRARLLTSLHSAAFIALDCSFSYVGDRRLTLKNIEHALCEFEKYRNNMIGGRRFVSREACDGGAVCTKCRDETVEHDDVLLLCDLCGTAQHTFCLRPKLEALPEAEWFCAPCRAQWDARP